MGLMLINSFKLFRLCRVGTYHNNMVCTWRAIGVDQSGAGAGRVLASLSNFSTQTLLPQACVFDDVVVGNGENDSIPLGIAATFVSSPLLALCGSTVVTGLVSGGPSLELTLRSDMSIRSYGFDVQFQWIPGCSLPMEGVRAGVPGETHNKHWQ